MSRRTSVGDEWRPPARARWTESDGASMLAALEASGESERTFCRRHGIGAHRVRYWRERLSKSAPLSGSRFVPARARQPAAVDAMERGSGASAPQVELELSGGSRLRFHGAWERSSIELWLRAAGVRS